MPQDSKAFQLSGLLPVPLWIFVVCISVYRMAVPPSPDPANGEADGVFAAAGEHLERIARERHPVGSAAHERLREYIVDRIRRLGLDARLQTFPLADYADELRWAEGGEATNVLVRLEGRGEGPALMVAAHYDSVPASFGAGDDGAAVASMLALLEYYSQAPPALNDIIFNFTDAEELCLCGAKAFVNAHPWAADVGMVLNFEARGTAGTSFMFETSVGNGKLVRHFAAAVDYPVTTSLFYEVYKYLPNDTDLTWFRMGGMPGINFAFIDEWPNYHSANDTPAALDRDTFHHHFSNMRQTLGHFAEADLNSLEAGDLVFFDLLSLFVVSYPPWIAILLASIALAAFLYLCANRAGAGDFRLRRALVFGLLVFPLSLAGVGFGAALVNRWRLSGVAAESLRAALFDKGAMAMFVVALCLLFIVLVLACRRFFSRAELCLPVLAYWTLAALLGAFLLPGASHVFVWPLLFVLAGLILEHGGFAGRRGLFLSRALTPLPLLLLWSQLIYMLLLALTLRDIAVIAVCLFFALALFAAGPTGRKPAEELRPLPASTGADRRR